MKKPVSMNVKVIGRRKVALSNLKTQLQSNIKTLSKRTAKDYEGMQSGQVVPLTDKDIERIKSQIKILEERV